MRWRIDATNPAEVLACAGLAHLAWRADRNARTGFVAGDGGGVRFTGPELAELSGPLELERVEGDGVRLGGVELDWWLPWGLNPRPQDLVGPADGVDGAPLAPPGGGPLAPRCVAHLRGAGQ